MNNHVWFEIKNAPHDLEVWVRGRISEKSNYHYEALASFCTPPGKEQGWWSSDLQTQYHPTHYRRLNLPSEVDEIS